MARSDLLLTYRATLKGCQFLLADVNAQLCMFVKEYTSTAAARGGNATELLVLYASLGYEDTFTVCIGI